MQSILITGGTGLIGSTLCKLLIEKGYKVFVLTRSSQTIAGTKRAYWDPDTHTIDTKSVAEADIIIHLAGTNIGGGRWTKQRKQQILSSRVETANLVFNSIKKSPKKPHTFISASAVGYYGAVTTDQIFTEDSNPSDDFLGTVCRKWEEASYPFQSLGLRTVILRTGVVFSPKSGALSKMALPFKFGMGAVLGSGWQHLPWIHINDLCQIYQNAIQDDQMSGVYNAVAPEHVNNRSFTEALSQVLNRKIWLPAIPGSLLTLLLGEMSKMVLEGSRVSSEKLLKSGFKFRFPLLLDALKDVLLSQIAKG